MISSRRLSISPVGDGWLAGADDMVSRVMSTAGCWWERVESCTWPDGDARPLEGWSGSGLSGVDGDGCNDGLNADRDGSSDSLGRSLPIPTDDVADESFEWIPVGSVRPAATADATLSGEPNPSLVTLDVGVVGWGDVRPRATCRGGVLVGGVPASGSASGRVGECGGEKVDMLSLHMDKGKRRDAISPRSGGKE